ncbi:TetR/AcrR family transcriptional regulator [Streptomyces caatingaensis]|uniref:TetR family transcriptional regulator n=1 Tax=Streptomyces caatingaensis TaxID=1678637 RepID=A0A0K9XIC2_9ACTN|nr:TetR family transcriptional regulator [Streptomyces caatingaensis]KNB53149.1 TetR family transcriptional regulator [Streptomyces caatingaensis]
MAAARRYDPERRRRIIDAAIRVVGRSGIAGLTHRTVAAEADVPLGSTTYHFKTLDDLLVAALRQAGQGFVTVVREHGGAAAGPAAAGQEDDLAAELARLTGRWLADRAGAELEYELYLAALRRPALRAVAAEWWEELAELLARRTDPRTGRALVALLDGVCLHVLLTGGEYDEEYVRDALGRLVRAGRSGR